MEIRLRIARYLWSSSRETWTASGDLWERVLSTMSSSTSEYQAIFDLYKSSLMSSGMRLNKRVFIIQAKHGKEKKWNLWLWLEKLRRPWQRTLWVCDRELCGCVRTLWVCDRQTCKLCSERSFGRRRNKTCWQATPSKSLFNIYNISNITYILNIWLQLAYAYSWRTIQNYKHSNSSARCFLSSGCLLP